MNPDDECRCGHARAYHDACSLCMCPWFLAKGNAGPVRRWQRERKERERREGSE